MLTRRSFLKGSLAAGTAGSAAFGSMGLARGTARAQPLPLGALQALIDAACRSARAAHGAPLALVLGAVGPSGTGQVLFAGQDGLTDTAGGPLTLTPRTPFQIGSITKVMTAALAYRRSGPYAGTLGAALGDTFSLSPQVAALTLQNLARYQPGLPQDNRGGAYPPGILAHMPDLFAYLSRFDPPFPQGTCYSYSNLGWSLLGMAAVGLTQPDDALYAARYDADLAAFARTFDAPDTSLFRPALKAGLPRGYRSDWTPLPLTAPYRPVAPPLAGAGSVVSTGADMLNYLIYNMGLRDGGRQDPALAYLQSMDRSDTPCTGTGAPVRPGYGWFHQTLRGAGPPAEVLHKNGGVAGFTSWMGFSAWQGTGRPARAGVFILANGPVATALGNRALKILLAG